MFGLETENEEKNSSLQKVLFKNGILMDTCGFRNNVVKIMPALTSQESDIVKGLGIIRASLTESGI